MIWKIIEVIRLFRYRVRGAWKEAFALLAFPFRRRVPVCGRCGQAWPRKAGNSPCGCGSRVIHV